MKHEHTVTHTILIKERKHKLHWTVFFSFFGPLVTAMILLITINTIGMNPPDWLNWTLLIVMVPMIIVALVIGQKKKLVGAYGETILLLIPTFVWLLPGHEQANRYMIIMSFSIIMIGVTIYFFAYWVHRWKFKNENLKIKITEVMLRIGFIAAAVTSTVIISIVLINWGDGTAHLAKVEKDPLPDYTTSSWITFISVVTIITALILVVLGIISNAVGVNREISGGFKKQKIKWGNVKLKKSNRGTKTIEVGTTRRRKWWWK